MFGVFSSGRALLVLQVESVCSEEIGARHGRDGSGDNDSRTVQSTTPCREKRREEKVWCVDEL